jgi:hypothetical protein
MRTPGRALLCLTLGIALTLPALAAPRKNIESTPQAKVYRASLKAIAAGDYQAYRKTLSSSLLRQMDEQMKGKSPKDVMDFVKVLSPTDVKLTSVKVEGKKAKLMVSAKISGQATKGSIELQEEGGQWKVDGGFEESSSH